MTQFINLDSNAIGSGELFGILSFHFVSYILPPSIESEENFDWIIIPVGLTSLSAFGTPISGVTININSFGITSQEQFSTNNSVGNITINGGIGDAQNYFGIPKVSRVSPVPLISSLIETQLPEFVREDHPHFIEFMEAYYEWLETYHNVQFDIARVYDYQDIDTTLLDLFVEQFFKEFLVNIPRTIMADKTLVLKHIKEFYRAKGTEKSYRFFFRILFDLDVDFYYPRVDILRVSDGKWIQPRTLRIVSTMGDPGDLIGRRIRGLSNNASAFVEKVQIVQEGYLTIYELYLNSSSISGVFSPNEEIKASDAEIYGIISPVVESVTITNAGEGYQVGQIVNITGDGIGATAKISGVNDLNGSITKIQMTNFGAGYSFASVNIPLYLGVTVQAQATTNIGSLTKYPGFFLNEDGQLSTTKYIQDGHFYQQFSYVVFVNESIEQYRDALKRLIHPAGLELFGGLRSQELIDASVKVPSKYGQLGSEIKLIEQHFWRLWEVYDLDDNIIETFTDKSQAYQFALELGYPVSKILEIDSYDNNTHHHSDRIDAKVRAHPATITLIQTIKEHEESFKLGPSYRSIERDKFYYKPFERKDVSSEMAAGSNPNYWGTNGVFISQFANYQVKDFGHIIIKDMNEKPWTKINRMPEPILKTSDETGIESEEEFGNHNVSN